jgi:hypothetical protein
MPLTAEQRAEYETELAALKKQKLAVLTGKKVQQTSSGDRSVQYESTLVSTRQAMDLRIAELEMLLGLRTNSRSRPFQF